MRAYGQQWAHHAQMATLYALLLYSDAHAPGGCRTLSSMVGGAACLPYIDAIPLGLPGSQKAIFAPSQKMGAVPPTCECTSKKLKGGHIVMCGRVCASHTYTSTTLETLVTSFQFWAGFAVLSKSGIECCISGCTHVLPLTMATPYRQYPTSEVCQYLNAKNQVWVKHANIRCMVVVEW